MSVEITAAGLERVRKGLRRARLQILAYQLSQLKPDLNRIEIPIETPVEFQSMETQRKRAALERELLGHR